MVRLVLCVLALLVAGGLADPLRNTSPKVADPVVVQRQFDITRLFWHPHEPNYVESWKTISNSWSFEKNIDHFTNVSAVTTYIKMLEHKWVLPRGVPFSIYQSEHRFEVVTLFNVLYSAKDYDTFYKSAVYLRERVNEYLYYYVIHVVLVNRKDTRGVIIPNIYEVFPSFFNNAEILATARRINVHGLDYIEYYPSTFKWNDNVVIRWNSTIWPYTWNNPDAPVTYFTHDFAFNNLYYNFHVAHPNWLGGEVIPIIKDRRGECFWYIHKQAVTRYYLERLSNGLGEIPELGHEVVETGYNPGLLYHNGVPYPVRPNNYRLDQPKLVDALQKIKDYERRIRDAIDQGYLVNAVGEHINLRAPETLDVLGRAIEADIDSPNGQYYKDFIGIWKKVLGNSFVPEHQYVHNFSPLVVPSVLEHYQTAMRDPAFYMVWKRVLGLFRLWQERLPEYKREELALPQVAIQKVEVDKLVTYFDHTYVNITNYLYADPAQGFWNKVSVLVQRPRLNHKVFQIRVNVKSEVAKSVVVRFFLGPKYDSRGYEIPLHENSQNFYQFDEFTYDLPVGETVITRDSNESTRVRKDAISASDVYQKVENALNNKGQYVTENYYDMIRMPQRLVLPKGHVGGMPFVLLVYISEYRAPTIPLGHGFDPTLSMGIGTGGHFITDEPLGFPVNRPLHSWQVEGLQNLVLQDVLIYHKHTPEIAVPHNE